VIPRSLRRCVAATAAVFVLSSCAFITKELQTGGEERLVKNAPPPHTIGPHVPGFAMDGACPKQFMDAVHSGRAPHLASILGKDRGKGLFEHAYAAPEALSILPSSTFVDWTAIFTGSAPGQNALPFMVWDGEYLIPIPQYLAQHRRPDLVDLEKRMDWLGVGPFGDRAGDIILLPKACTNLPTQQRYAFARIDHYSWHGSVCEQDGHIPFILAKQNASGEDLRAIMDDFGGESPSERELTPVVISILSPQ